MEYQLAKKGYLVGDVDAIHRRKFHGFNYPDDWVDIVHADSPGKAKAKFAEYGDIDFIDCRCIRAKEDDLFLFEGETLTLNRIEEKIKMEKWRKLNIEAVNVSPEMEVVIFSNQWGCYWRENAKGYTTKKDEAGIYSMKDAWDCVSHCGHEKGIEIRPLHLSV